MSSLFLMGLPLDRHSSYIPGSWQRHWTSDKSLDPLSKWHLSLPFVYPRFQVTPPGPWSDGIRWIHAWPGYRVWSQCLLRYDTLKPFMTLIHLDRYPYPHWQVRVLAGTVRGTEKSPGLPRYHRQQILANDLNIPNRARM
jgi:hypothetical protein